MRTTKGAKTDLRTRRVVGIAYIEVRVAEQPEQSHEIGLKQQVHMDECANTATVVEVSLLRIGDIRAEWARFVLHLQPRAGVSHIIQPRCVSRIELGHWMRAQVDRLDQ